MTFSMRLYTLSFWSNCHLFNARSNEDLFVCASTLANDWRGTLGSIVVVDVTISCNILRIGKSIT